MRVMSSMESHSLLKVCNLSKSYHIGQIGVQPLKNICFELEVGSIAAIMGPSGCGKSTLLNLLAGIDVPDSGAIHFLSKDIAALSSEEMAKERLRHIGVVFQFFNLLPTLTIAQNVSVPGHLIGMKRREREHRTGSLLEQVGIADLANRFPHEMSGGEIQRAAIARALFNRPSLLLADEPTGNLDQNSGRRVIEIFKEIVQSHPVGILVVTHDHFVSSEAHRVFHLEEGKLVE